MKTVFIAGHKGLVGSAIHKLLQFENVRIITKSRDELDLSNDYEVERFFCDHHIDEVYLAAAKVGGIKANLNFPADFLTENLKIQTNVINACSRFNVKKMLFIATDNIYPTKYINYAKETDLKYVDFEGKNYFYKVGKLAGIILCESYNSQFNNESDCQFRIVVAPNLFGPNDKYDIENSHVVPSLILKAHIAKISNLPELEIWGDGTAKRELMYSEDFASSCIFVMNLDKHKFLNYAPRAIINSGVGKSTSISELADKVCKAVKYKGQIIYNKNSPTGEPLKSLDSNLIKGLGWTSEYSLAEGLELSYKDFIKNYEKK